MLLTTYFLISFYCYIGFAAEDDISFFASRCKNYQDSLENESNKSKLSASTTFLMNTLPKKELQKFFACFNEFPLSTADEVKKFCSKMEENAVKFRKMHDCAIDILRNVQGKAKPDDRIIGKTVGTTVKVSEIILRAIQEILGQLHKILPA